MIKAEAIINPSGSKPNVQIVVGHRKIASLFSFALLSADATTITPILSHHEGVSEYGPEVLDVDPAELVSQFLIWSIVVTSVTPGTQTYAIDVILTQDSRVLGGRTFRHRGTMEISQLASGRVKFLAA